MRTAGGSGGSAFERVYSAIVALKGVYGLLELLGGLALLFVPDAAGGVLIAVATELAEGASPLRRAAASSLAAAGSGIVAGAVPFALFLLVHGVVKLLTAYALLRRAIRWYPWAIAVLSALLVVQVVDVVGAPAQGGWVLAVLDVLVLALVVWEYRRLQRKHFAERRPVQPVAGQERTHAR